jgi:hypothetical protein
MVGNIGGVNPGDPVNQGWFRDTDGTFTIFNPPGSISTNPGRINDAAQSVGGFGDATGFHGYLYSGGSFTIIDVPGSTETGTFGINDSGQIVGITAGLIPEPGSMMLFGSGLAGVWAFASRKRSSE